MNPRYQIVASLGPASASPPIWAEMLAAGATRFRLNTSHLSLEALEGWLDGLERFLGSWTGPAPQVVLDLQGSKWRLGELPAQVLEAGQVIQLVLGQASDQAGVLPVPHAEFFGGAHAGDEVAVNDGKIRLQLGQVTDDRARAEVMTGGELLPRKGITLLGGSGRVESLSEKDRRIVRMGEGLPWVSFAISYVKNGEEMASYRGLINPEKRLGAKLERQPALQEAPAIARQAGELWLCRGDLGAELGPQAMAQATARFSTGVKDLPVPTLMAGQVLEHLVDHPQPTRSEVCYLYDCLEQGYAGFVLSDETAVGQDPVAAVKVAALFV